MTSSKSTSSQETDKRLFEKINPLFISMLLKTPGRSTGCFEEFKTTEEILSKLKVSIKQQERTSRNGLMALYSVYDVGTGIDSTVSSDQLKALLSLSQIDPLLKVHLLYSHGNIYTCLMIEDLDINLLLTTKVSLVYHLKDNEVVSMKIGEFTPPNRLYLRKDLDGAVIPLRKALSSVNINSFHVLTRQDFELGDIPF